MNLKARVKRLERQHRKVAHERFRLIVTEVGNRFDLAKATCSRTLLPNGQLMEIVKLHGSRDALSDEDLEKFIQVHPIEGPL